MRLTIHRGTHEVGGNCVEVESQGTRLILDVGLPIFDADGRAHDTMVLRRRSAEELRVSGVLADIPGLYGGGPSPDAILLSHAHEDHTGLLKHSRPGIPVYVSRGTSKMMNAGSRFAGQPRLPRERSREVAPAVPFRIGSMTVTGYPVDHSVYGAMAFLIEGEERRLLYSGDLRTHGRKPGMTRDLLKAVSEKPINVLLMEGTHIGHPDLTGPTEYVLEGEIVKAIEETPGLVLASFSPQHVDRLVAFLRASKRTGRTFVADAYTAYVMHLIRSEVRVPRPGSCGWVKVFFPEYFEQAIARKRLERFAETISPARIWMEEIQKEPEKYVMLFRPSMLESDFDGMVPEGTTCISSRWAGYLDRPEWKSVSDTLSESGGRLLTIHTSGHIFRHDLVDLVRTIQPKTMIPIHTFEPKAFGDFIPRLRLLHDGEVAEIG